MLSLSGNCPSCAVAPLVGAWIEIDHKGYYCSTCAVAPLVGAWIEISCDRNTSSRFAVAPLVGAWIEILQLRCAVLIAVSLPSWERGLKSAWVLLRLILPRSLPSWERGLKCALRTVWGNAYYVAPLVGAWIEIVELIDISGHRVVAPLVGAWIEIPQMHRIIPKLCSRSPRGSVD